MAAASMNSLVEGIKRLDQRYIKGATKDFFFSAVSFPQRGRLNCGGFWFWHDWYG